LEPRGIRVNVVCPGSLDTEMKRQNIRDAAIAAGEDPEQALSSRRLGDPDGVARILAFLASEDADYLLGTVFTK
jgi:NAD(P)-dependent dehydrogenase (short-subunit alcohol dehydrogenase family)